MIRPHWEKLVSRTEEMLHWDSSVSMRREPLKIGATLTWGTRSDLVVKNGDTLGTFYSDPSREQLTNLGDFCKAISPELDIALQEAIRIVDHDLTAIPGKSRDDARELYKRFRLDMGIMLFGLVANSIPVGFLEKEIGAERVTAIEEQAFVPFRPTLIGREARAILAVQDEFSSKDRLWLETKAAELANEFGFIHSEYVSKNWTPADYLAAIEGARLDVHSAGVVDSHDFNDYQHWLLSVIQKLSYLHDEGKAALVRTNWALRRTFIALGLDDIHMLRLTEPEFFAWAETGGTPDSHILEARGKYFGILSLDDEWRYYTGKDEIEQLVKEQGMNSHSPLSVNEVKGSVASRGKVTGTIRIVETQEDSKALIDGEILVASMTTPAYIDAMRRAGAYVTDEGGTICHAAIVAREFKKPCIVGTKNATKIFKNGDMVEVDAEKGIVRKI